MKRLLLLILALGALLLLAACGGEQEAEQPAQLSDGPLVTVYRAPT